MSYTAKPPTLIASETTLFPSICDVRPSETCKHSEKSTEVCRLHNKGQNKGLLRLLFDALYFRGTSEALTFTVGVLHQIRSPPLQLSEHNTDFTIFAQLLTGIIQQQNRTSLV